LILRLENLTHTYKTAGLEARTVLDIGMWSLGDGIQLLVRGVSGSGKTTLFNIIAGLLRPTTGEVYLGEQALYRLPEAVRDRARAQKIGYIFQTHHLLPAFTALENVIMPLQFAGTLPASHRAEWAKQLLVQVGLGDYLHHRPSQLSTGQRLRVAVARGLANQPSLILADEPTAALDPDNGAVIMDLLQTACRQTNATLIVASHDPALADRFDQQINLHAGKIAAMPPIGERKLHAL